MEERGDEFALHTLSERELAHLHINNVSNIQNVHEFAEGVLELRLGDFVDFLIEKKAVHSGKIPPELILLPHDDGELFLVFALAFPRSVAQHLRFSPARIQNAREHFKRGGFSRSVRPKKPDEFALFNRKRDIFYR